MRWKHFFRNIILERGYDYFCSGAVENLSVEEDKITATVCGSEEYDVEINLSGDLITELYCSCPYAEGGDYCKHMAAVLFACSEDDVQLNENKEVVGCDDHDYDYDYDLPQEVVEESKRRNEVSKLLEEVDEKQMREFLTFALQRDPVLLVRFKTLVKPSMSMADIQRYKEQIDDTIEAHLGRDYFISYYDAIEFIEDLEVYLDEDIKMLIDAGQYWHAFDLTSYLFAKVGNVDMDDSNGFGGMFIDRCVQIWYDILEQADAETKDRIFKWMTSKTDKGLPDYLENQIEEVLMSDFKEEKYLLYKLEYTEKRAASAVKAAEKSGTDYYASKWATRHVQVMEELNLPMEEIEQYCKFSWKYKPIRRFYIQKSIEREDFDKAISILKESLILDADFRGVVKEHSRTLKDIYLRIGDKVAYLQQLWDLILKDDAGAVDIYKELRSEYDESEWIIMREKIFAELPQYASVDQLYIEDRLFDRLLDFVISRPGLFAMHSHEEVLKKMYPDALLTKYRKELKEMAARSADRNRYREWVRELRRMLNIKGGNKVVRQLVEEWRIQYKNRPAMMDELDKLTLS